MFAPPAVAAREQLQCSVGLWRVLLLRVLVEVTLVNPTGQLLKCTLVCVCATYYLASWQVGRAEGGGRERHVVAPQAARED